MNVGGLHSDSRSGTLHLYIDCCRVDIDKATNTFINATLELESAIQQYQRAEAKLGSAVTNISKKGRYHQSAHRQSFGKCSHEIKGVCKCQ